MYIIGIPKEIKEFERRVSIVPNDIKRLFALHELLECKEQNIIVYVQANAGHEAGYSDEDYIACGAIILDKIEDIYDKSNIIVKVKEPQPIEFPLIKSTHTILSFFHFAGNNKLIDAMIKSKATCYAYETIKDDEGRYPILAPMSIIAGKKAMVKADNHLMKARKKNIYTIITIIGVGNVGRAAAEQAVLLGYKTINLIDNDYEKIKIIEQSNPTIFKAYEMNEKNLKKLLIFSNIIISSIYTNGMKASRIITNKLLDLMSRTGSIIMDVAIDQGGTTEQSMPMTLKNPIIKYNNTSIYCVPNIPSTEPTEASIKLSNSIYPYLHSILFDATDDNRYFCELQRGLYVNQN
jgi:alanine dehydrogenase